MRPVSGLLALTFCAIGPACAPDPTASLDDTVNCLDGSAGCCYGAVLDNDGFRCSPEWTGEGDGPDLPPGDETADATADEDTGEPRPQCGATVLEDGGFELGTPSAAWAESSPLFGTPICDANCSVDPGALPHDGAWFAWFGGAQEPSEASLSQTFSVSADAAQLRFWFAIEQASGSIDDTFAVVVDGNTVFLRTGADMDGFEEYVQVPVTLDQWADGAPHELRFESQVFGGGLTNFFVDDVELVGCGDVDEPRTPVDGTGTDDADPDDSTGGDGSGSETGTTGDDATGESGVGASSTGDQATGDSGTATGTTGDDAAGGSSTG